MKRTGAKISMLIVGLIALAAAACGDDSPTMPPTSTLGPSVIQTPTSAPASVDHADVIDVTVTGSPGDYSLSVTVSSPDTGCRSYADWWEVVSEAGELLVRRVLLHSHVEEQPFTRSGGPLTVQPDVTVIIRAHMSGGGYGGAVMRGSVAQGFSTADVSPGFAADLENQEPLPSHCAF